jgi:hypothetical protein
VNNITLSVNYVKRSGRADPSLQHHSRHTKTDMMYTLAPQKVKTRFSAEMLRFVPNEATVRMMRSKSIEHVSVSTPDVGIATIENSTIICEVLSIHTRRQYIFSERKHRAQAFAARNNSLKYFVNLICAESGR